MTYSHHWNLRDEYILHLCRMNKVLDTEKHLYDMNIYNRKLYEILTNRRYENAIRTFPVYATKNNKISIACRNVFYFKEPDFSSCFPKFIFQNVQFRLWQACKNPNFFLNKEMNRKWFIDLMYGESQWSEHNFNYRTGNWRIKSSPLATLWSPL